MFRTRALQAAVLVAAVATLAACASHKAARVEPVPQPAVAKKGGPHGYRFNMTQHGKKMSADDFEAWMKANGLHVAKGAPAKGAGDKAKASAKAKPKAKAKPEKVAAVTTAPKPPPRD